MFHTFIVIDRTCPWILRLILINLTRWFTNDSFRRIGVARVPASCNRNDS